MKLGVFSDLDCEAHRGYAFLAEKPQRLEELRVLFRESGLEILPAKPATPAMLELAHHPAYVAHIEALSKKRMTGQLGDFVAGKRSAYLQYYLRPMEGTYRAATAAAGCVVEAVQEVIAGKLDRAFCAVRPPGHHAGVMSGEGFCFFNNVAIGALTAARMGKRVAIVDFDRHHGNGTQQIVEERGRGKVLLVSSFRDNCKYAKELKHKPPGRNIVTIPVSAQCDFEQVRLLYEAQALPAIKAFKPDLLMFSAGFDMHKNDKLKDGMLLESADFEPLTEMVIKAAAKTCGSKVVSVLEGGYKSRTAKNGDALWGLKESVAFHLKALQR